MIIRAYTADDYATLACWWEAHGWPAIEPKMLPTTGVIADEKAAGFLYQTDSKVAWMEWIVADPAASDRGPAIDAVISSLSEIAADMGFELILTSVKHPGLIQRYINNGFTKGDESMTNLHRRYE